MSDHQGSLFGPRVTLRDILNGQGINPRDPGVTPAEEARLSDQCKAILSRLRKGPATNRELATIALKYTGRLSDLRAAGFKVEPVSHDRQTGLVTYQLSE